MNSNSDRGALRPLVPVLTMILAATAVPIELRQPHVSQVSFVAFPSDVTRNIVGYVPLGIALSPVGPARVAAAAAALATFAEVSQLFMAHRQPSGVDITCNVIGATLGAVAVLRRRQKPLLVTVDHRAAVLAAMLATTLVCLMWWRAPLPLNSRGWTAPGTLEAQWTFDEAESSVAVDSSGHELEGTFSGTARRVPGIFGNAVSLNGATDYVDVGRATEFRLVGSMTVSAWIKVARFPSDDTAIVSTHSGIGYQLDTTVDRGPRTIGFKLGDACGHLMARYGATPLVIGRWYHLAGVYDAPAKILDVYLDGKLDNGFLLGTVTAVQRSSREALYIGRRSSDRGFEFTGLIDDVRVYSRALTRAEINTVMRGRTVAFANPDSRPTAESPCPPQSDWEDSQIPAAAGLLGILVGVICLGFWPTIGLVPCGAAGLVGGLLLLPGAAPSLPAVGRCLIPLTSVAGAVSVVRSWCCANARLS